MKADECHGLKDALTPSGCSYGPGASDAFLYVVKGAHLCLCCSGQGLLLVPQVSWRVSCHSCLAGGDDVEHKGKPSGLGPQQREGSCQAVSHRPSIALLGCDTAKLLMALRRGQKCPKKGGARARALLDGSSFLTLHPMTGACHPFTDHTKKSRSFAWGMDTT